MKKEYEVQQKEKARSFTPSLNAKSLKIAQSQRQKGSEPQTNMSDKDDSFEEVKVGTLMEVGKARTYSLRGSAVNKKPWIDDSEMNFRNFGSKSRTKFVFMR